MLAALAQMAGAGMMDQVLVRDSLARVHPRLRSRWLSERGIKLPDYFEPRAPESDGIQMLGKWGRGPSYEVTGRDSLVFLSLGSEVAIINFADPDSPEVLSEPQAMGLVTQAAVWDSFLYIGAFTGAAGIEIWNIADPRNPIFRNRVLTRLTDFCTKDSFAYVTQRSSSPSHDTFKVYNLAHPDSPQLVGFCRDSGQAVTVSGNTVILGDWYNLFALDVSDPANPHRVGQYPGFALSVAARGNICCAAFNWNTDTDYFRFEVLDISNPASIIRLGYLDNIGGYDIHLDRSLAYVSGFYTDFEFAIVSMTDSTHPALLGGCTTPGWNFGVWADSARSLALVADNWEGLKVINTSDLGQPVIDTAVLPAGQVDDISVDGNTACISGDMIGLKVLDVTNPALPVELSGLDTTGQAPQSGAVAVRDSFAFVAWTPFPTFRSVDITDRARPYFTGGCNAGNPSDMVLRDSFAYVAAVRLFSVVNLARPRQPTLVGSCTSTDGVLFGLVVQDSLAYEVSAFGLWIISVSNPDSPFVVSSTQDRLTAAGLAVRDTFALIPNSHESLWVYSVANASEPYPLAALQLRSRGYDIVLVDTLAWVGEVSGMEILSIADPARPRSVAFSPTPYLVRRLAYREPYVYAAMSEAGVAVYDSVLTGIGRVAS